MNDNVKSIQICKIENIKKVNTIPVKVKRLVSVSEKWKFTELDLKDQYEYIENLMSGNDEKEENELIRGQIQQKIRGYKSQDIIKKKYSEEKFIDLEFVIKLLYNSLGKCYYCKNPVCVVYEYVRDKKQWTIERIDNSFGHNKDNVEIACLNCNLNRRTMYHERYLLTKQIRFLKLNTTSNEN
jgi:5-methylcytosine-specific restriction endonuclease McrA